MNPPAPSYRKLPGGAIAFSGLGRLWLADDHILEVRSLLFHERYRRFFLPDIAALVIRRTRARLYWNLAHGLVAFGGGAVIAALYYTGTQLRAQDATGPWPVLYIFASMLAPFALFSLVVFLLNSLLGPTCRCHLLTTSAGWHPLAAPTRLRAARHVLAQLAPFLEAVQKARVPAVVPEPVSPP